MDYPELIAEVTHRTGDASVAVRADLYAELAEADLNMRLRTAGNESTATIMTDAAGVAALPVDFSHMRALLAFGREQSGADLSNVLAGYGCGYAVSGGDLITTWPLTSLTLRYYARLPPVSSGPNWLLAAHPGVYIAAIMQQVYLAALDAEKAAAAGQVLSAQLARIRHDDAIRRFEATPFVVGEAAP